MMCYRREHENNIRSLARSLSNMYDRADRRVLNWYRNRDRHTFIDLSAYINPDRNPDENSDSDSATNG